MPLIPGDTERAYAAGLVDGEGSFGIYRSTQIGRVRPSHVGRLIVGMTDPMALWRLRLLWGGHLTLRRPRQAGHKPCYLLTFSGPTLLALLQSVGPYLITKEAQGQMMECFLREVAQHPQGKHLTSVELAAREDYRIEIARLNGR